MSDDQVLVLTPEQSARLWQRFRLAPSGCLEWQHTTWRGGYGRIKVSGRDWVTSRLVWSLQVGPIPDGMSVCHRCDNPSCGNVDHLFLGTALENNRDSASKGRSAIRRYPDRYHGWPGTTNANAKLTDDVVVAIRERYAAGGISQQRLADEYGIHQGTVSKIVLGRAWQHIQPSAGPSVS